MLSQGLAQNARLQDSHALLPRICKRIENHGFWSNQKLQLENFQPFLGSVHQQNSQAKLLTSFAETARPGKNLQHKPWPFSGFGICTCFFVWRVSVQKGPVRRWFTCIAKGFTVFSVLCSRQGIEALCNFVTRIVPTWSSLLSIGPAFCGTVPSF